MTAEDGERGAAVTCDPWYWCFARIKSNSQHLLHMLPFLRMNITTVFASETKSINFLNVLLCSVTKTW